MSVTIPHAAMQVPEDSMAQFRKKFSQFEGTIGKYAGPDVNNPVAGFAGMMTRLDQQVGQLLELLKELDIDDNTLIMLSSDNGPHKEGGHQPDFFDSNGPLRGYKRDLYEGGIRTPLLARWPRKLRAGSVSNLISAHWDMLPTFCELAGAKTPENLDGISMLPTLLGRTHEQTQHEAMYWEFSERGRSQAARIGNWKGIRVDLKKNPDAPIELYDLSKDIGEEHNIADQHPEVVAQLRAVMKREHVDSESFPLF
jgi:arylsulfatase A-like enzyme